MTSSSSMARPFLRRFYVASLLALLFPLAVGALATHADPSFAEGTLEAIARGLPMDRLASPFLLFMVILLRNAFVALLLVVGGVLAAVPTILILVANGLVIGSVGAYATMSEGLLFTLAGTLPHGLFELVAITLCGAHGLRIGASLVARLRGIGKEVLADSLFAGLRAYIGVAIPLLVIAAFVEAYITPLVVNAVLKGV